MIRWIIIPLMLTSVYAGPTLLKVRQSANQELVPSMMHTTIAFEAKGQNPNAIKADLNTLVVAAKQKQEGLICSGGSYTVAPWYEWDGKKNRFMGYVGNNAFSCEFETIDPYNTLVGRFDKLVGGMSSVKMTQYPVEPFIPESTITKTIDTLQQTIVNDALLKAKAFSQTLKQECRIQAILFVDEPHAIMEPMAGRAMVMKAQMEQSVAIEAPLQKGQTVSQTATVELVCQ